MVPNTKKKLFSVTIKDCEVQTFRCPGKGGQNVNKVSSGVRIIHHPSGSIGQACDTRDQFRNKRLAFERMASTKEFKAWNYKRASEVLTNRSIDDIVLEQLQPEKLRVEVRTESGWQVIPAENK
jgi:protein subunit release factor B